MPLVEFVQEGKAIDYTPGSDVESGAVVVENDLVGVTKRKILANQEGALHVEGVFDFPKATGVSTAIARGVLNYWDVADQEAKADDEAGANKLIGKSIKAATDDDTHVRIRISQ